MNDKDNDDVIHQYMDDSHMRVKIEMGASSSRTWAHFANSLSMAASSYTKVSMLSADKQEKIPNLPKVKLFNFPARVVLLFNETSHLLLLSFIIMFTYITGQTKV